VRNLCILVWDLSIIVGTFYLIGWKGFSPWWILLALVLLENFKEN